MPEPDNTTSKADEAQISSNELVLNNAVPCKRGRSAKEKKEVIKRQCVTKPKSFKKDATLPKKNGTSDGGNQLLEADRESTEQYKKSSGDLATSENEPEPELPKEMSHAAPEHGKQLKQKQSEKAMSSTNSSSNDQNRHPVKSLRVEEAHDTTAKAIGRGSRRRALQPRYAESDDDDEVNMTRKTKAVHKQYEALRGSPNTSKLAQPVAEAGVSKDIVAGTTLTSKDEDGDVLKGLSKRRGRPPKQLIVAMASKEPTLSGKTEKVDGVDEADPAPNSKDNEEMSKPAPKRRSRLPKQPIVATASKKLARSSGTEEGERADRLAPASADKDSEETFEPAPKRRGRPPKAAKTSPMETELPPQAKTTTKARKVEERISLQSSGQLPSIILAAEPEEGKLSMIPINELANDTQEIVSAQDKASAAQPKRRGRPPKVKTQAALTTVPVPEPVDEGVATEVKHEIEMVHTKSTRGRPAKAASKQSSTSLQETDTKLMKSTNSVNDAHSTDSLTQNAAQEAIIPRGRRKALDIDTNEDAIIEPTKVLLDKKASRGRAMKSTAMLTIQPSQGQEGQEADEAKPSKLKSERDVAIVAEEHAVVVEEVPVERGTDSLAQGYPAKKKKRLAATTIKEDGRSSTMPTERPPVLAARSANILLSPRRSRITKPTLPMFKMKSKSRAEGEWQKEDWFEPSVPSALLI